MPYSSFHFKTHRTFFEGHLYLIYERPFLGEFLRSLRGKKIAIWTAANIDYAQFIVENIIKPYLSPDQRIEFVWASEHCDESMRRFGKLKHLNMLDKPDVYGGSAAVKKRGAVIIDDNIDLLGQAPNKVYVIPRFSASIDDGDDVELLRALHFIGNAN